MHSKLSRNGKWVLENKLDRWGLIGSERVPVETFFVVRESSSAHGILVRIVFPSDRCNVVSQPDWVGDTESWALMIQDLRNYQAHLYTGRATPISGGRTAKVTHSSWPIGKHSYFGDPRGFLKILGQTGREALIVVGRITPADGGVNHAIRILLQERSPRGGPSPSREWAITRPEGMGLLDICWSEKTQRIALLLSSGKHLKVVTMQISGTDLRVVGWVALDSRSDITNLRYLPNGTRLSFEHKGYLWTVDDVGPTES